MWKCDKCGETNENNNTQCKRCGNKRLIQSIRPGPRQNTSDANAKNENKQSNTTIQDFCRINNDSSAQNRKHKPIVLIVAIACALLIAITAVGIMKGKKTTDKALDSTATTTTGINVTTRTKTTLTTMTEVNATTQTKTPSPTRLPTEIGSVVQFGHYEQDNNTTNGKESIEWIVLAKEGNRILLISKYALDCQPYNTTKTGVTWETCSLRKWLNGSFMNTAFSVSEQNSIICATVKADINPSFITSPGNNTADKMFLLSITEADVYFNKYEARKCSPTNYAIAQGAATSEEFSKDGKVTCWWWLRSPGYDPIVAARIDCDGSIFYEGRNVNFDNVAIRPAMWISTGS